MNISNLPNEDLKIANYEPEDRTIVQKKRKESAQRKSKKQHGA
jgi:hypothetical protein